MIEITFPVALSKLKEFKREEKPKVCAGIESQSNADLLKLIRGSLKELSPSLL